MQTRTATADGMGMATGPAIAAAEGAPSLPPRVSWGAVFAGGVVAVTVGAMLNILGLAIGATTIDPIAPGETPSASTLGIAGGIWLLVANLVGLAVGGYVAARLSGTSDDTDGVLHGLSVWAVGFLLSAVLLGNVIAGTASTAFSGASSILGGAAQGAGQAVQAAAPAVANNVNPQALADRLQSALQTGGDPAAMTSDQRRAEMTRIVTGRVTSGSFEGNARDRLTRLVAAEYNVTPQQAGERITQLESEAQRVATETEARARQAAETASNAAATSAYWLFAAMLLGAVAAVLGARTGTRRAVVLSSQRAYG
ncbi:hypothetical protein [Falsiroseomonas sp. CW058]|uniref:hypothetical protein n=1 Tax=Falsiroseomonas sp. CW058 TaxID=3388664 RepID=UPI003D3226A3